ncbi:ammonium transporter [Cavenderia fasciculata]|uniref:Ammonium transporter n=1 Tax=Cavenderia fasciculata TaxID=261658 RepID=F4PWP7_CACFS|nr:ammonium transporter [Cavenderia fasciculata]EGG20411.1 ammonium transporter [Cavenderia fasciculata]|eukprot:XP_004367394.1 ammonium transporter [Cavenderia fasciculata]
MSSQDISSSSQDALVDYYIDTSWILDAANLVFFMQAGFGMIEAGMVRAKNTKSILLKNMINTAIGAIGFYCFGHAFAYAIGRLLTGQYDLVKGINGLVAGLVSSTAGCAYIEPWAGIVVGAIGAIIYYSSSWVLLNWAHIDDPVDAVSVHLFGGAWSVISVAFFAKHGPVRNPTSTMPDGIIYGGGIGQLWIQLVAVTMATLWATIISSIFFQIMKYFQWFRVDVDTELAGLDNMNHGGAAIFDF